MAPSKKQTTDEPVVEPVAPTPRRDKTPVARVETFATNGRWGFDALDLHGRKLTSSPATFDSAADARAAAPSSV